MAAKKWFSKKVMHSDSSTVPTMMSLPRRELTHTVTSWPASQTPRGHPSTTPSMGRPLKNTVRCHSRHRATRCGPTHRRAKSNIRWMTTPMVRLTVKFLPYQYNQPDQLAQAFLPLAKAKKPSSVKKTASPAQNSTVHSHCSQTGPYCLCRPLLTQEAQLALRPRAS